MQNKMVLVAENCKIRQFDKIFFCKFRRFICIYHKKSVPLQQFFVQESVITHILFVQKSVVAHKLYVWKNVKKKDRRHAYPMEKYAESQAFGDYGYPPMR